MQQNAIMSKLRDHKAELLDLGVMSLYFTLTKDRETEADNFALVASLDPAKAPPSLRRFAQRDDVEKRLIEILGPGVRMTVGGSRDRRRKPKLPSGHSKVF